MVAQQGRKSGGSRKLGRDQRKCELYRSRGIRGKNKDRKAERHRRWHGSDRVNRTRVQKRTKLAEQCWELDIPAVLTAKRYPARVDENGSRHRPRRKCSTMGWMRRHILAAGQEPVV